MSLEEEKTKEFAVHACRGASDGRKERDAVIFSVVVAVFVFRFAASLSGPSGVSGAIIMMVRETSPKSISR